jgi:hypothetical protein
MAMNPPPLSHFLAEWGQNKQTKTKTDKINQNSPKFAKQILKGT